MAVRILSHSETFHYEAEVVRIFSRGGVFSLQF
jgi:hypothetical protein